MALVPRKRKRHHEGPTHFYEEKDLAIEGLVLIRTACGVWHQKAGLYEPETIYRYCPECKKIQEEGK